MSDDKENIEQEKVNKQSWWRNVRLWETGHFAQDYKILAKVVKSNLLNIFTKRKQRVQLQY